VCLIYGIKRPGRGTGKKGVKSSTHRLGFIEKGLFPPPQAKNWVFSAMLKKKKAPPFFDKKKKGAFSQKSRIFGISG